MVGGFLRAAQAAVRYVGPRGSSRSWVGVACRSVSAGALQLYRRQVSALPTLGAAAVMLAAVAAAADGDDAARSESKQLVGGLAVTGGEGEEAGTRLRGGRRLLLKQRSKHQAKLQEVDQMKTHLDEYKQHRGAIDSLRARFDMYASKSAELAGGRRVKAMTFTDFLHSFVLPQFHLHAPVRQQTGVDMMSIVVPFSNASRVAVLQRPDLVYSCDFVGDVNGLITFEECYLLVHLLQSKFVAQDRGDRELC
jgi:hypothetical protein